MALGGCGDKDPSALEGRHLSTVGARGAPHQKEIPNCTQVGQLLSDIVGNMVASEKNADGKFSLPDRYGVECIWATREVYSSNPWEVIKNGGAFSVSITVDQTPEDEAEAEAALRSLGTVYDDPRVSAIGGYIFGAPTDSNSALQMIGPMVIVGPVSINMSGAGVLMSNPESMQHITHGGAIDAAVRLHSSLR